MEQQKLDFEVSETVSKSVTVTTTKRRAVPNAGKLPDTEQKSLSSGKAKKIKPVSESRRKAAKKVGEMNAKMYKAKREMKEREAKLAASQVSSIDFTSKTYSDRVELTLDKRCEIVHENGKVFMVRKPIVFPLSVQESLKILGAKTSYCVCGYNDKPIKALYKLLICHEAYLKVTEENKPVWKEGSEVKYCIKHDRLITSVSEPCVLAFHSEDTRNLFYANFKYLIDECKEII